MKNKFAKNIHLMMLMNLTGRINFYPILSIYFLSLNNTFANEVGIYMGAGYLAGFLLEVPSGYISDVFGHKKTLIIGKISLFISMLLFISASYLSEPLVFFILAMIFQLGGKTFASGSDRAILYDSLKNLNREDEFVKIQTKLSAVSSLLSTIVILGLPFFTKISIIFPFYIVLVQYLCGILVASLLVDTENHKNIDKNNKKRIRDVIKENRGFGLFPYLLFGFLLQAFLFSDASFRPLYMKELGLPVIFMGASMGISRFLWYVFYPIADKLSKNFKLKQIYLGELIFVFIYYILISYLDNSYAVAILFGVGIGFIRALKDLPSHFIIKHIKDNNYKATMLSVAGQISLITQAILVTIGGFIMNVSYKLGFFSFAFIMLVTLGINYIFILKSDIEK